MAIVLHLPLAGVSGELPEELANTVRLVGSEAQHLVARFAVD